MNEDLICAVKLKCYISIDEEDVEVLERLNTLMADAQVQVAHIIGVDKAFDFSTPGLARSLYLNYIWYAFNDCQNDFEENYLSDIIKCRDYFSINEEEKDAE